MNHTIDSFIRFFQFNRFQTNWYKFIHKHSIISIQPTLPTPINVLGPLNETDSLEGCRFFRSSGLHLYEAYSIFSVNDKALMNGTVYLIYSQILRRMLFSICSYFFGANSLAKNVSEKQHVFCLQTRIQSERTRKHAARGGLILTGFSLTDAPLCMSQTKMTTGDVEAGGNRVQKAASRIGGWRWGDKRWASKQQISIRHLAATFWPDWQLGTRMQAPTELGLQRTELDGGKGSVTEAQCMNLYVSDPCLVYKQKGHWRGGQGGGLSDRNDCECDVGPWFKSPPPTGYTFV